jgi:hypothetical protein
MTGVTPEFLLRGAGYALQQCGLLLRDASLLYRSDSYSSAVVLAAFAREELGKWMMLLDAHSSDRSGALFFVRTPDQYCALFRPLRRTGWSLGACARARAAD